MEDVGQLLGLLEIHLFFGGRLGDIIVERKLIGKSIGLVLDLLLTATSLFLIELRTKTFEEMLVLLEVLQCFLLRHVLAGEIGLYLKLLLDQCHLLVLLTCLVLSFFNGIPCFLLVLV